MTDEFVENLKQPSAWLRVLFMAGFVLALYVSGVILLVLMLAQILFSLITGSDNTNLRRLGSSLTRYVSQILEFLTYNTEDRPFPFASFPLAADSEVADVTAADTGVANPGPTAPAADMETAAESAARVMAESAARRATKSTSKTPRAIAGESVAENSAASTHTVSNTSVVAAAKPDAESATDTGPEMGVTDVIDKQVKDV